MTHGLVSVLLAAGRGRRMGKPKALLTWRDELFLQHLVTVQAAAGIHRFAVVTPSELLPALRDQTYPLPFERSLEWLRDSALDVGEEPDRIQLRWVGGQADAEQLVSFHLGLRAARQWSPTGVLVGPVDQGPYPISVLQALLASFEPNACRAWIPVWEGRRGHPVLLGGGFLLHLDSEHPEGLRGILQDNAEYVTEVPVSSSATLRNLNTPLLYEQFLHQSGG